MYALYTYIYTHPYIHMYTHGGRARQGDRGAQAGQGRLFGSSREPCSILVVSFLFVRFFFKVRK